MLHCALKRLYPIQGATGRYVLLLLLTSSVISHTVYRTYIIKLQTISHELLKRVNEKWLYY